MKQQLSSLLPFFGWKTHSSMAVSIKYIVLIVFLGIFIFSGFFCIIILIAQAVEGEKATTVTTNNISTECKIVRCIRPLKVDRSSFLGQRNKEVHIYCFYL